MVGEDSSSFFIFSFVEHRVLYYVYRDTEHDKQADERGRERRLTLSCKNENESIAFDEENARAEKRNT